MQELLKQQIRSIKQTKSEEILSARELADISIRKGKSVLKKQLTWRVKALLH